MAAFVNQFPQSHYAALSIQLYAVGTAQRKFGVCPTFVGSSTAMYIR